MGKISRNNHNQVKIDWGTIFEQTETTYVSTLMPLILKIYRRKRLKSCLEIGAGKGVDAEYLRKNKVNITAIDNDKKVIKIIKKRFPKLKSELSDFLKSGLKKKYDLVYSQGLVEHLSDELIGTFFERAKACLNDKGVLVVDFPPTFTYYAVVRKIFGKIYERDITVKHVIKIGESKGFRCVKKVKRDFFIRFLKTLPFNHISMSLAFIKKTKGDRKK